MNNRFMFLSCLALISFVTISWGQIPGTPGAPGSAPNLGQVPASDTVRYHLTQANQLYVQREWGSAIKAFSNALRLDPKLTEALLGRAMAYMANSEPDKAVQDLRSVIAIDPKGDDGYNAHLVQSQILEQKKDLKNAIKEVDRALAIKPKEGATYYTRAKLKEAKGDWKGAMADYGTAISLLPKIALYYDLRGQLRCQKQKCEGALADFDKALEIIPRHVPFMIHRGDARKALGDFKGAMDDYDRALKRDIVNVQALMQRGRLKAAMGQAAEAQADFDQAIKIDPSLEAPLKNELSQTKH